MKARPLGDKVLIQRDKAKDKTDGGILLPDAAQEKTLRGKVLEVGPGRQLDDGTLSKMSVKKGQRVIFGRYAGNEIGDKRDRKEEDLLVMREDDILAVIEEE